MTALLNIVLDLLVARLGKLPGYACFGVLFGAMILAPCVFAGVISIRAAVAEAIFDGYWMLLAGVVIVLITGDNET